MPSPFPGMDPYLEAHWRDVHARLVIYITDAMQDQLPGELRARVEERVVMETPEGIGNGLFPDVRVVEYPRRVDHSQPSAVGVGKVEPLVVEADPEPITETFIHVIDTTSGNRVVTVVEVLSPTNKLPGSGRDQYKRKQEQTCRSDTNLVEIDLIRSGKHVAAVALANVPTNRRTPYLVCIRRATTPSKAEIYPIALQESLPRIRIPLRPQDQDVSLDLQALIAQVYQRGRYDGDIDYTKNPDPPLTSEEKRWVAQLMQEKGLRSKPPRRRKGGDAS